MEAEVSHLSLSLSSHTHFHHHHLLQKTHIDSARLVHARESMDHNYTHMTESQSCTRELHRVLCMQGGDDDVSYVKNSEGPASAVALSKPLLIDAVRSMRLFEGETSIRIADLGCATGNNTISTMEAVVNSLRRRYEEKGEQVPEFEAFFSDLQSNDFNSLFRLLMAKSDSAKRAYYPAGVPGSFYGRLFSKGKLHLAVSLSALHWLSKIPEAVLDNGSPAWNKGRAWIDGARKEVIEAYSKQSEEDLEAFLRCRKEEIMEGGMLFMLMAGRPGSQQAENQLGDPDSRVKHPFTVSMDRAWDDLLNEGLIDEETRDKFNIPAYMRSTEEVTKAFNHCRGFEIQYIGFQRIAEHSEEKQQEWIKDPCSYGRAKANLVRATLKPIIEAHLGPMLSEELFKRFERKVAEDITMLHKACFYGVIIVCAIRK